MSPMAEQETLDIADFSAIPKLARLDARVPKWDTQALRSRGCPICRRRDSPLLTRPDGLPVSYCGDCALWYVCGMPAEAEIRAIYQGYWFDYRPTRLDGQGVRAVRDGAKTALRVELKLQRLTELLGTLQGKLILEVGAGRGDFLAAARYAGADVVANDISPEACDFMERALDIPVVRGELAEAAWDFASPDAIVMSDLVEHPIEPLALLCRAASLLKPGGRLAIWTPNGGGAGHEAGTGERWVGFRVDLEHLQYFSPRTIQVLANRLGLHIDHLETTGYPGLSGIDRLPTRSGGTARDTVAVEAKRLIKRWAPWTSQARQMMNEWRRPRVRGSYHLFAILAKPGAGLKPRAG